MYALKKFYYRTREKLLAITRPSYAVDFSTDTFLRELYNRNRHVQPTHDLAVSGLDAPSLGHAISYFQPQKAPVFFHSTPTLLALVDEICEQRSEWRRRTLDQARREVSMALDVYGISAPPLTAAFYWIGNHNISKKDLLYRLRVHRFYFIPRLALACIYEPKLIEQLQSVLLSWMRFATTKRGGLLAYNSNLCVIQRVMACMWARLYIGSGSSRGEVSFIELEDLLLKIIFADIRFLLPRLGQSYGNNHLLADYFAGWLIGRLLPEFVDDQFGQKNYEQLWITELFNQTYEDGWSFEHSTHYHEFGCEMGLCYLLLCRRNSWPVTEVVEQRLKRMLLVQAEIAGSSNGPLRLGDCIEDNFFPLGVHEGLGPSLHREVYRTLFDHTLPAADRARPEVEAAFWLLGGLTEPSVVSKPASSLFALPQGGLYRLTDEKTGLELLFRTGPACATNIYAGHAHADWLTFYLAVDGEPVIVDAGTYSYRGNPGKRTRGEPAWRQYFRGPEAHNGVVISGQDPLGIVEQGDFRPRLVEPRVDTRALAVTPGVSWLQGELKDSRLFEGYARGVVCISQYYMLVYDRHPQSTSLVWSGMQFATQSRVIVSPGARVLKDRDLTIGLSAGFSDVNVYSGSLEPLAGWISEVYGSLVAAPQARMTFDGEHKVTGFVLARSAAVDWTLDVRETETSIVFELSAAQVSDCLVLNTQTSAAACHVKDTSFEGSCLWVRRVDGVLNELRAVDVRTIALADSIQITFSDPEPWLHLHLGGDTPIAHTASGAVPDIRF